MVISLCPAFCATEYRRATAEGADPRRAITTAARAIIQQTSNGKAIFIREERTGGLIARSSKKGGGHVTS